MSVSYCLPAKISRPGPQGIKTRYISDKKELSNLHPLLVISKNCRDRRIPYVVSGLSFIYIRASIARAEGADPSWGPLIPIEAEIEAFKAETVVGMGKKENIADEETKSHWHKEERRKLRIQHQQ